MTAPVLSPNTQSNTMGVTNHASGQVTTDAGTATAQTFTLGFAPRIVRFHNLTDRISDEWYEGMASASSLHTVAAGTRTLETTNGIAVSGSTFTLTAVTMVASKVYVWEAVA
jgi:phosphatidylserine synthase